MRKWKCPHNVKVEGYTTIMEVSGYGGVLYYVLTFKKFIS